MPFVIREKKQDKLKQKLSREDCVLSYLSFSPSLSISLHSPDIGLLAHPQPMHPHPKAPLIVNQVHQALHSCHEHKRLQSHSDK